MTDRPTEHQDATADVEDVSTAADLDVPGGTEGTDSHNPEGLEELDESGQSEEFEESDESDESDESEESAALDEGWTSAPLPVPSSLPEGAVLEDRPAPKADRGLLTSARSKARKAAVELLFEAEQRGMNAGTLLADRVARPTTQVPLRDYTVEAMRGVVDNWAQIDETIATYSRGWRLERMPAVDRAILRVATWEIRHNADVPAGVAVSEAVVLARVLSTDDSPTFVNGLLSRIAEAS